MTSETGYDLGRKAGDAPKFDDVVASLDPAHRAVIHARLAEARAGQGVACELCISVHSGKAAQAEAAGWSQTWDGWLCPAHGSDAALQVSDQARLLLAEVYASHSFKRLHAIADRLRSNDAGLGEEVKLALAAVEKALSISTLVMRDATDVEIAEWTERHDLTHALPGTDARTAFEDAQSLCLDAAGAHQQRTALSDEQCIAIYDAVSASNITRDVKTAAKKVRVVRRVLRAGDITEASADVTQ